MRKSVSGHASRWSHYLDHSTASGSMCILCIEGCIYKSGGISHSAQAHISIQSLGPDRRQGQNRTRCVEIS
jgi:hypothetical protein